MNSSHVWLRAAGIYNLVWGASVIACPHLLFDLFGMQRVNYPEIWQCVGMIVGVYGVGYLIAAGEPQRHWPIVLVGLLGKVFGPIGFAMALYNGVFPLAFGLTIVTNDLIWWAPFSRILWDAAFNSSCGTQPRCRTEQFVRESRILASPEVVFRFHESPDALIKLIPPWENVQPVESSGGIQVGAKVVLKNKIGPFAIHWVAIHFEYDPPRLFADRQESGPFTWWSHRHRFETDGSGGTILRDEIEYALPLGAFGRWIAGRYVRNKIDRMFAYRHEVTRKFCEAASAEGASA